MKYRITIKTYTIVDACNSKHAVREVIARKEAIETNGKANSIEEDLLFNAEIENVEQEDPWQE